MHFSILQFVYVTKLANNCITCIYYLIPDNRMTEDWLWSHNRAHRWRQTSARSVFRDLPMPPYIWSVIRTQLVVEDSWLLNNCTCAFCVGVISVAPASKTLLKMMGSYLVFAFTGFLLILIFLEKLGTSAGPKPPCLKVIITCIIIIFSSIAPPLHINSHLQFATSVAHHCQAKTTKVKNLVNWNMLDKSEDNLKSMSNAGIFVGLSLR